MIDFNRLTISDDYEKISLDVSINTSEEYLNFYISRIYVEYYKNRNAIGVPSEKAAIAFSNEDTSVVSYVGDFNIRTMREYEPKLSSFQGGLFYIIVVCKNESGQEVEIVRDIASVLDWRKVHSLGMQTIADFNSGCRKEKCDISDKLEEFVLVWHSLEFAVNAKDLDQIDRLWSRFISIGSRFGTQSCNC